MLRPGGRQGCAAALMLQGGIDHAHAALHTADRNGVGSWQDLTEQGTGCGIGKMRSPLHLKVFKLWCHAGGHHPFERAERSPHGFVRAATVPNPGTLHIDQTKHRFDLPSVPALEPQPGITALTVGMRRGDALALTFDQMLLCCSKQGLTFGQAHSKWIGCRGAINCGELNALGASFVVDKMSLDNQSHDAPPNCGQIRILALAIK